VINSAVAIDHAAAARAGSGMPHATGTLPNPRRKPSCIARSDRKCPAESGTGVSGCHAQYASAIEIAKPSLGFAVEGNSNHAVCR
jgi:hypothetical protein